MDPLRGRPRRDGRDQPRRRRRPSCSSGPRRAPARRPARRLASGAGHRARGGVACLQRLARGLGPRGDHDRRHSRRRPRRGHRSARRWASRKACRVAATSCAAVRSCRATMTPILEVSTEDGGWVEWTLVDNFVASEETDRHFVLDLGRRRSPAGTGRASRRRRIPTVRRRPREGRTDPDPELPDRRRGTRQRRHGRPVRAEVVDSVRLAGREPPAGTRWRRRRGCRERQAPGTALVAVARTCGDGRGLRAHRP